jgi:starch-binding outer membrane protein, SusD/RagB family
LRAMAHFDLARVFSKPLQFAQTTDLGIPYVVSSDASLKPARTSVQETFQLITNEMEQAASLINTNNGIGRLNKASVQGLLSRLYLYTENWQKVIDNATLVIDASSGLASTAEFPLIWKDQTEKEVLFKIRINDIDQDLDGTRPAIGTLFSQTGSSGVRSEYVADYAFYQTFPTNDVRRNVCFSTSSFAGKVFNHIAKYFGRSSGNANTVDAKVLRLSEVYLNRAEAYAQLNQDVNALNDLNALRSKRYTSYTPGTETGSVLKDAIAFERRKELAFEGHRFFDLKRKGLAIQRSTNGDESNGGGLSLPDNVRLLEANSFKFQLPIPQSEINANPAVNQNPGY